MNNNQNIQVYLPEENNIRNSIQHVNATDKQALRLFNEKLSSLLQPAELRQLSKDAKVQNYKETFDFTFKVAKMYHDDILTKIEYCLNYVNTIAKARLSSQLATEIDELSLNTQKQLQASQKELMNIVVDLIKNGETIPYEAVRASNERLALMKLQFAIDTQTEILERFRASLAKTAKIPESSLT